MFSEINSNSRYPKSFTMAMIKSFSCRGLGVPAPELSSLAENVSRAGFDAIDLPLRDLMEAGISAKCINEIMKSHGLQTGASPFPYDWRTDEDEFKIALRKLPWFLGYARELNVTRLYTRVSEALPEGESRESVLAWHRERLGQIAWQMGEFEMQLGLETVGVESFRQGRPGLMANLSSVRRELAELFNQNNNLGLLVDLFHLHAADESLEDAIGPFRERIVGIHVADLPDPAPQRDLIIDHERDLPETSGAVSARKWLSELAEIGCCAPVMVETVRTPVRLANKSLMEIIQLTGAALNTVWPTRIDT